VARTVPTRSNHEDRGKEIVDETGQFIGPVSEDSAEHDLVDAADDGLGS
jgi:hypothetical protein